MTVEATQKAELKCIRRRKRQMLKLHEQIKGDGSASAQPGNEQLSLEFKQGGSRFNCQIKNNKPLLKIIISSQKTAKKRTQKKVSMMKSKK